MSDKNKAFSTALMGVAAVGAAMVVYYYVQSRTGQPENQEESTEQTEAGEHVDAASVLAESRSEFAGLYAATDGAMEVGDRRITSFAVASAEGSLAGSVQIDTVGGDAPVKVPCTDVRIDAKEFFLKCQDPNEGLISLNGVWSKDPANQAISVAGKVLWTKSGTLLLDTSRTFQLLPN